MNNSTSMVAKFSAASVLNILNKHVMHDLLINQVELKLIAMMLVLPESEGSARGSKHASSSPGCW